MTNISLNSMYPQGLSRELCLVCAFQSSVNVNFSAYKIIRKHLGHSLSYCSNTNKQCVAAMSTRE